MFTKNVSNFNSKKRKTGNIFIILLLTLVPILGFGALAVDYGVLVNDKNRLQRACDASALAAAQELKVRNDNLDTQSATTVAIATAKENGVTVTASDISFSDENTIVKVDADLTRGLFFARVLGITQGNTGASATASVTYSSPGYTPYVSPIGITSSTFDAYKDSYDTSYDLSLTRHQKEAFGQDDIVLFDLRPQSAKSGAWMLKQLLGIDKQPVTIAPEGTVCGNITTYCQTTLNASKNSETMKFKDGIETLMEKAAGSPWNDTGGLNYYYNMRDGLADYSNPRVLNIIVTHDFPTYDVGTTNMPILSFVPVYIEGYDEDTQVLKLRFLPPGSAANGDVLLPGNNGEAMTGTRVVRLLD